MSQSGSRPSLLHWGALVGVAAVVGAAAGWIGSRAGAPEPAAPPEAQVARDASEVRTATAPPRAERAGRVEARTLPRRGALRIPPPPRAAGPALPAILPSVTAEVGGASDDDRVALVERMLRSADPADKWSAIDVLAGMDDPRAYDLARAALRDAQVATGAAHVLAQGPGLGDEDVAALRELMGDTGLPGGERAGYNAAVMAAMRAGKAPGDLAAWARSTLASDAPEIRGSVVAHVVTLPSEQAVPLLIEALEDADPMVADGARNALIGAHGGDPELGHDAAGWSAWWERKRAGAADAQVPAVPPLPEGFVRPESSGPAALEPAPPAPDAPEAP